PRRSNLAQTVRAGIHRLRRNRAVAPRYDKLAGRDEVTVHVAAMNEWPCPTLAQTLGVWFDGSPAHRGRRRATRIAVVGSRPGGEPRLEQSYPLTVLSE